MRLKADYPESLVGVKVGGHFLFYGEDAEKAAAALGLKAVVQEIPGLGKTSVTGSAWDGPILPNSCSFTAIV